MLEAGIRRPDDTVSDPGSHSAFSGGTARPFLRRGICVSIRAGFIWREEGLAPDFSTMSVHRQPGGEHLLERSIALINF